jgi:hypothetical protein
MFPIVRLDASQLAINNLCLLQNILHFFSVLSVQHHALTALPLTKELSETGWLGGLHGQFGRCPQRETSVPLVADGTTVGQCVATVTTLTDYDSVRLDTKRLASKA